MRGRSERAAGGWRRRLPELLRRTFGLKHLREGQAEVIERVMAGRATLAVMPTGAGKSLCYQLPALLLEGRTLVVSPLIALMKDQCDKLRDSGVPAVELHSALNTADSAAAEQAVADGSARIVFTTPERLAEPVFIAGLRDHPIDLVVIDEAHCISQWGHDFRPAFLEIGNALPQLGAPRLLALTATATPAVIEDVRRQLGRPDLGVVNTGVYRPNLHYAVVQATREDEKLARLRELVPRLPGAGLVYAATVKSVEEVHDALAADGASVTRYHGRLSARERKANQDAFMRDEARVMVATNAFGLGIDKPDTRFVIHYQMPSGLDAYYQESGRAGRDGEAAHCTLLYLHSDRAVQQFFLTGRYPGVDDVRALYQALHREPPEGGWTLDALQAAVDRPLAKLRVALALLRQQEIVAQDRHRHLRLMRTGLDDAGMAQLMQAYAERRDNDRALLERMVFYGQTGYCRWKVLLEHFGESEGFSACGHCDNCLRIAAATRADRLRPDEAAEHAVPEPRRAAFASGDAVRVPRYGPGRVTAADAETVTVEFAAGPSRCFLAEFVSPA